jgi:membrane-associated protease RseP (regulator of RpoE activity)
VLTAITTTAVGAFYSNEPADSWLAFFLNGWVFSVPLMTILLVHEMGHFLTGRRHRLDVSPPYFLPAIWPLGTFGAFIKIRSPIVNRKVLVEVGASGPIAGALVAVPLLLAGLFLSQVQPGGEPAREGLVFGSSIVLELLCLIRFGHLSSSANIMLHPTALAAWFGLFVTAMNLLPMGQLDGGHVIYALFGPRRARNISVLTFLCLLPLGLLFWLGWLVFAAITLFIGLRHPPLLDPESPLDPSGRVLGYVAVLLFILTFIPVPIAVLG